jgi:hypothetical protein
VRAPLVAAVGRAGALAGLDDDAGEEGRELAGFPVAGPVEHVARGALELDGLVQVESGDPMEVLAGGAEAEGFAAVDADGEGDREGWPG